MSYAHIDNLYKSQEILLFKEVFAVDSKDARKAIGRQASALFHASLR